MKLSNEKGPEMSVSTYMDVLYIVTNMTILMNLLATISPSSATTAATPLPRASVCK